MRLQQSLYHADDSHLEALHLSRYQKTWYKVYSWTIIVIIIN